MLTKRNQRFKQVLLTVLAIATLSGCSNHESSSSSSDFKLSDYAGRWVILNYWAEWCTPCLKEIPELNMLHDKYSDQLAVVAVNFDGITGPELNEVAERMNFTVDIAENDPADELRLSRPASLPTTYLFGPTGELKAKLVGPQTTDSLLERIDSLP